MAWQELALLYNPGVQPDSATRQLKRWVDRNRALKEELIRTGLATPRSPVNPCTGPIYYNHLGEP